MSLSLRSALFSPTSPLVQNRWFRYALRALIALLALWLLAWLAVAPLTKGPLERLASEQLGRKVTIGHLDFKPWSLEVALRDVAIEGMDGAPPQLTIGRIYADGELQSLLRWAPVVDAVSVEDPALRITHLGDGRYDVDDLIARLSAPSEDPEPKNGPARLALYNLALTGGHIDFIDKAVNATHEVRGLTLKVPFVSTLPSQREVTVEPHLAFTLDGSPFDSSAQGTPFAQTGKADAQLRLDGLNLEPYLGYLPAHLPVKVVAATLDADVKVAFEQHPRMAVKLTGTLQTSGVRITDRKGADLLSYERLTVDMADVRPLEQVVHLQHVELTSPVLSATRHATGEINLAQWMAAAPPPSPAQTRSTPPATEPQAAPETPAELLAPASATAPASSASAVQRSMPAPTWAVQVATAAVRGGTVRWTDHTTRPAAAVQAHDLTLDVTGVALPFAQEAAQPVRFEGGLALQGSPLRFSGEATDRQAEVQVHLQALALQLAAPYLNHVLEPTVAGQLTGDIGVQWAAPTAPATKAGATGLTLTAGMLALDQLGVRQGKNTLASWGRLEVAGAQVSLDTRTATLDRLALHQPRASVERATDGRWMFEQWMRTAAPDTVQTAPSTPAAAASPWKLRIADVAVQGGSVAFADHAQPRRVALEISTLDIKAQNVSNDGDKPQPLQVSARVATSAPRGGKASDAGRLVYQGTLAPQPLALQGRVSATRLPLHALDGYLAGQLALELLRADVGYRGQVALSQNREGFALRLAGDAVVEDLRANSTAASTPKTEAQVGEELLAWKSLSLRGLSVATAPGTAPRIEVKETSLADFFARITVNEAGRINLTDIAKTPEEARAANASNAATAASAASGPAAPPAATAPDTGSTVAAAASAPTVASVDPLAPVVQFGPVSLVNGRVAFSDFFIRPNYSADLSELTGKLSAFASQTPGGEPVLADLELRGRAEGSASLEVTGKLNPLVQPLALDITGKVRDLELPPLTPYAVKYAGHGIERGKLSMDVSYKVLPSGQLTASNRLVLNQLTFGEPVPGAPNSLPVKLAVALLADRQGVIDLNLPISGSLNDPQFRLGPVIGRIIVNLIGKALTAPFSLLASAFGGGDEMSHVPFAPGSAELTPEARQNLDKVAKALADRPALKLTVTGMASLQAEREGLQRERLRQMVLAEKRRATRDDAAPEEVSDAEYPDLLKAVYRRADMPKPRNLVGLAKDLAVPEMEALLITHLAADDALAAEVAAQRGQAIRAYLLSQKLPAERLFVAAPKSGNQSEKWSPRADLALGAQ